MSDVMQSAIKEIGRQVREQHEAREWCRNNPYPSTMEDVLAEELERRTLGPSHQDGGQS